MRGRKSKQESRSAELRQKLVVWKQTPESLRPSLRALARELNISHQLLNHYLDDLEEWQAKESHRRAKDAILKIRARAETERRPITPWEERQIDDYDRASAHYLIHSMILGRLKQMERELEQQVKAGRPPSAHHGKMVRIFASKGMPQALAIIEKYFPNKLTSRRPNLPRTPCGPD